MIISRPSMAFEADSKEAKLEAMLIAYRNFKMNEKQYKDGQDALKDSVLSQMMRISFLQRDLCSLFGASFNKRVKKECLNLIDEDFSLGDSDIHAMVDKFIGNKPTERQVKPTFRPSSSSVQAEAPVAATKSIPLAKASLQKAPLATSAPIPAPTALSIIMEHIQQQVGTSNNIAVSVIKRNNFLKNLFDAHLRYTMLMNPDLFGAEYDYLGYDETYFSEAIEIYAADNAIELPDQEKITPSIRDEIDIFLSALWQKISAADRTAWRQGIVDEILRNHRASLEQSDNIDEEILEEPVPEKPSAQRRGAFIDASSIETTAKKIRRKGIFGEGSAMPKSSDIARLFEVNSETEFVKTKSKMSGALTKLFSSSAFDEPAEEFSEPPVARAADAPPTERIDVTKEDEFKKSLAKNKFKQKQLLEYSQKLQIYLRQLESKIKKAQSKISNKVDSSDRAEKLNIIKRLLTRLVGPREDGISSIDQVDAIVSSLQGKTLSFAELQKFKALIDELMPFVGYARKKLDDELSSITVIAEESVPAEANTPEPSPANAPTPAPVAAAKVETVAAERKLTPEEQDRQNLIDRCTLLIKNLGELKKALKARTSEERSLSSINAYRDMEVINKINGYIRQCEEQPFESILKNLLKGTVGNNVNKILSEKEIWISEVNAIVRWYDTIPTGEPCPTLSGTVQAVAKTAATPSKKSWLDSKVKTVKEVISFGRSSSSQEKIETSVPESADAKPSISNSNDFPKVESVAVSAPAAHADRREEAPVAEENFLSSHEYATWLAQLNSMNSKLPNLTKRLAFIKEVHDFQLELSLFSAEVDSMKNQQLNRDIQPTLNRLLLSSNEIYSLNEYEEEIKKLNDFKIQFDTNRKNGLSVTPDEKNAILKNYNQPKKIVDDWNAKIRAWNDNQQKWKKELESRKSLFQLAKNKRQKEENQRARAQENQVKRRQEEAKEAENAKEKTIQQNGKKIDNAKGLLKDWSTLFPLSPRLMSLTECAPQDFNFAAITSQLLQEYEDALKSNKLKGKDPEQLKKCMHHLIVLAAFDGEVAEGGLGNYADLSETSGLIANAINILAQNRKNFGSDNNRRMALMWLNYITLGIDSDVKEASYSSGTETSRILGLIRSAFNSIMDPYLSNEFTPVKDSFFDFFKQQVNDLVIGIENKPKNDKKKAEQTSREVRELLGLGINEQVTRVPEVPVAAAATESNTPRVPRFLVRRERAEALRSSKEDVSDVTSVVSDVSAVSAMTSAGKRPAVTPNRTLTDPIHIRAKATKKKLETFLAEKLNGFKKDKKINTDSKRKANVEKYIETSHGCIFYLNEISERENFVDAERNNINIVLESLEGWLEDLNNKVKDRHEPDKKMQSIEKYLPKSYQAAGRGSNTTKLQVVRDFIKNLEHYIAEAKKPKVTTDSRDDSTLTSFETKDDADPASIHSATTVDSSMFDDSSMVVDSKKTAASSSEPSVLEAVDDTPLPETPKELEPLVEQLYASSKFGVGKSRPRVEVDFELRAKKAADQKLQSSRQAILAELEHLTQMAEKAQESIQKHIEEFKTRAKRIEMSDSVSEEKTSALEGFKNETQQLLEEIMRLKTEPLVTGENGAQDTIKTFEKRIQGTVSAANEEAKNVGQIIHAFEQAKLEQERLEKLAQEQAEEAASIVKIRTKIADRLNALKLQATEVKSTISHYKVRIEDEDSHEIKDVFIQKGLSTLVKQASDDIQAILEQLTKLDNHIGSLLDSQIFELDDIFQSELNATEKEIASIDSLQSRIAQDIEKITTDFNEAKQKSEKTKKIAEMRIAVTNNLNALSKRASLIKQDIVEQTALLSSRRSDAERCQMELYFTGPLVITTERRLSILLRNIEKKLEEIEALKNSSLVTSLATSEMINVDDALDELTQINTWMNDDNLGEELFNIEKGVKTASEEVQDIIEHFERELIKKLGLNIETESKASESAIERRLADTNRKLVEATKKLEDTLQEYDPDSLPADESVKSKIAYYEGLIQKNKNNQVKLDGRASSIKEARKLVIEDIENFAQRNTAATTTDSNSVQRFQLSPQSFHAIIDVNVDAIEVELIDANSLVAETSIAIGEIQAGIEVQKAKEVDKAAAIERAEIAEQEAKRARTEQENITEVEKARYSLRKKLVEISLKAHEFGRSISGERIALGAQQPTSGSRAEVNALQSKLMASQSNPNEASAFLESLLIRVTATLSTIDKSQEIQQNVLSGISKIIDDIDAPDADLEAILASSGERIADFEAQLTRAMNIVADVPLVTAEFDKYNQSREVERLRRLEEEALRRQEEAVAKLKSRKEKVAVLKAGIDASMETIGELEAFASIKKAYKALLDEATEIEKKIKSIEELISVLNSQELAEVIAGLDESLARVELSANDLDKRRYEISAELNRLAEVHEVDNSDLEFTFDSVYSDDVATESKRLNDSFRTAPADIIGNRIQKSSVDKERDDISADEVYKDPEVTLDGVYREAAVHERDFTSDPLTQNASDSTLNSIFLTLEARQLLLASRAKNTPIRQTAVPVKLRSAFKNTEKFDPSKKAIPARTPIKVERDLVQYFKGVKDAVTALRNRINSSMEEGISGSDSVLYSTLLDEIMQIEGKITETENIAREITIQALEEAIAKIGEELTNLAKKVDDVDAQVAQEKSTLKGKRAAEIENACAQLIGELAQAKLESQELQALIGLQNESGDYISGYQKQIEVVRREVALQQKKNSDSNQYLTHLLNRLGTIKDQMQSFSDEEKPLSENLDKMINSDELKLEYLIESEDPEATLVAKRKELEDVVSKLSAIREKVESSATDFIEISEDLGMKPDTYMGNMDDVYPSNENQTVDILPKLKMSDKELKALLGKYESFKEPSAKLKARFERFKPENSDRPVRKVMENIANIDDLYLSSESDEMADVSPLKMTQEEQKSLLEKIESNKLSDESKVSLIKRSSFAFKPEHQLDPMKKGTPKPIRAGRNLKEAALALIERINISIASLLDFMNTIETEHEKEGFSELNERYSGLLSRTTDTEVAIATSEKASDSKNLSELMTGYSAQLVSIEKEKYQVDEELIRRKEKFSAVKKFSSTVLKQIIRSEIAGAAQKINEQSDKTERDNQIRALYEERQKNIDEIQEKANRIEQKMESVFQEIRKLLGLISSVSDAPDQDAFAQVLIRAADILEDPARRKEEIIKRTNSLAKYTIESMLNMQDEELEKIAEILVNQLEYDNQNLTDIERKVNEIDLNSLTARTEMYIKVTSLEKRAEKVESQIVVVINGLELIDAKNIAEKSESYLDFKKAIFKIKEEITSTKAKLCKDTEEDGEDEVDVNASIERLNQDLQEMEHSLAEAERLREEASEQVRMASETVVSNAISSGIAGAIEKIQQKEQPIATDADEENSHIAQQAHYIDIAFARCSRLQQRANDFGVQINGLIAEKNTLSEKIGESNLTADVKRSFSDRLGDIQESLDEYSERQENALASINDMDFETLRDLLLRRELNIDENEFITSIDQKLDNIERDLDKIDEVSDICHSDDDSDDESYEFMPLNHIPEALNKIRESFEHSVADQRVPMDVLANGQNSREIERRDIAAAAPHPEPAPIADTDASLREENLALKAQLAINAAQAAEAERRFAAMQAQIDRLEVTTTTLQQQAADARIAQETTETRMRAEQERLTRALAALENQRRADARAAAEAAEQARLREVELQSENVTLKVEKKRLQKVIVGLRNMLGIKATVASTDELTDEPVNNEEAENLLKELSTWELEGKLTDRSWARKVDKLIGSPGKSIMKLTSLEKILPSAVLDRMRIDWLREMSHKLSIESTERVLGLDNISEEVENFYSSIYASQKLLEETKLKVENAQRIFASKHCPKELRDTYQEMCKKQIEKYDNANRAWKHRYGLLPEGVKTNRNIDKQSANNEKKAALKAALLEEVKSLNSAEGNTLAYWANKVNLQAVLLKEFGVTIRFDSHEGELYKMDKNGFMSKDKEALDKVKDTIVDSLKQKKDVQAGIPTFYAVEPLKKDEIRVRPIYLSGEPKQIIAYAASTDSDVRFVEHYDKNTNPNDPAVKKALKHAKAELSYELMASIIYRYIDKLSSLPTAKDPVTIYPNDSENLQHLAGALLSLGVPYEAIQVNSMNSDTLNFKYDYIHKPEFSDDPDVTSGKKINWNSETVRQFVEDFTNEGTKNPNENQELVKKREELKQFLKCKKDPIRGGVEAIKKAYNESKEAVYVPANKMRMQ